MTAAHWRSGVGERWLGGSVIATRPRCPATGKVRYSSPTEAWVAAFVDFGTDPRLNAYTCEECEGTHLGHTNWAIGSTTIRHAQEAFETALREMLPTINELRAAAQIAMVSAECTQDSE